MGDIDHVDVHIVTGDRARAGTAERVQLGLGGKEFELDSRANDFQRGADVTEDAYRHYAEHSKLPQGYDLWRQHTYGALLHVDPYTGKDLPEIRVETFGSGPAASAPRAVPRASAPRAHIRTFWFP